MTKKPITIAGVNYNTKSTVKKYLQDILHMGGVDDLITEKKYVALLDALFHARQSKVAKLNGRTILGWGRERNPANICFAALCSDGAKLHFSFINSLDALYLKQEGKTTPL